MQFLHTSATGSLRAAVLTLTHEIFVRSASALDGTVRTGEPAFAPAGAARLQAGRSWSSTPYARRATPGPRGRHGTWR
ncbi:hypothetical protein GCM10010211_40440 [Streptomyces albospinus]|uniref:Uncharacterized protein n=1 Tax=Streptomyces albospinus TaxID=285515 RepID=A0ABQ2V6B2_9ACTN|nr:hypothetical protein [Streptomyces albospinus]GGU70658.1 hypothetical protein GCM10010211_40440 [Streptomyces albospinus]